MHLFPEDMTHLKESLDRVYERVWKGAGLNPPGQVEANIVPLSTQRGQ